MQAECWPTTRNVIRKMVDETLGALERHEKTLKELAEFDFSKFKDSWATAEMAKALE